MPCLGLQLELQVMATGVHCCCVFETGQNCGVSIAEMGA